MVKQWYSEGILILANTDPDLQHTDSYHDSVELVWTVERLVQAEPLQQIVLHFKRINVRKRLLGPRQYL